MRRGNIDDPAPAFSLHGRPKRFREVKGRAEVDGKDSIPLFLREGINRRNMLNTSIIYENVDGSKLCQRLTCKIPDRLRIRHIGRRKEVPHAGFLRNPASDLGAVRLQTVKNNVVALRG